MTLSIAAAYYNSSKGQTIVTLTEEDTSVFVRFEATLAGDQLGLSEAELLDRSLSWFTNRYIGEYAQQKLDENVRNLDAAVERADKAIVEVKELSATSRRAFLKVMMKFYEKDLITDDEMEELGLLDEE